MGRRSPKGKEGPQSPIIKFIEDSIIESLLSTLEVQEGDIIFFGAGKEISLMIHWQRCGISSQKT